MSGSDRERARGRRAAVRTIAIGLLACLSACDLAPTYRPPVFLVPDGYRGSGVFGRADPQDDLARGPWWERFGDPVLDRLEAQATVANPTLAAIAEQYTQARDLAAEARADLFPQVQGSATTSDSKRSQGRPFPGSGGPGNIASLNQIQAAASWEPDFWDRIRNQTRVQKRLAQSDAAYLASARLILQAELASDYVQLRGLDSAVAVYRQSIGFYETAVRITRLRQQGLIASGLDVARAQNQLSTAQALLTDTQANRAVLLHAIAVLTGADPIAFALPEGGLSSLQVAVVPPAVPSVLLQRRPDVAQAEREMAAANASIGVSRAAFYPDISISAIGGFQDTGFNLASLPNSIWTIGATAALPLFEGGLRRAELQRSWSQYRQTRDQYRATVLGAFQEVEDGLAVSERLAVETRQQQDAVTAAEKAQQITIQLYTGGLTNYLDAVVAQVTALTARIALVQAQTRQLQARVTLIRGLGGGWRTENLPTEDGVLPFNPVAINGSDRQPRPDGTGEGTLDALHPPVPGPGVPDDALPAGPAQSPAAVAAPLPELPDGDPPLADPAVANRAPGE